MIRSLASSHGTPFENIVKLLPPVHNLPGSLNKSCEVCFHANILALNFLLVTTKPVESLKKFFVIFGDLTNMYHHAVHVIFFYFGG